MKTEVEDPDLVDSFEADGKGRITLGKDFADKDVKVAVEVQDDNSE